MNEINGPISRITGAQNIDANRKVRGSDASSSNSNAVPVDKVDISDKGAQRAEAAEFAKRLDETPATRQERIDQIKADIEAGRYPPEGALDQAIDGLLDDLGL